MIDINEVIARSNSSEEISTRVSGVYVIVNKVTMRAYVGQTKDLHARMRAHWSALRCGRHSNRALQSEWDAFGESCFLFCPVMKVDGPLLLEQERRLIGQLENPYNLDELVQSPNDRGQGRKPIKPGEETVTVCLRVTPAQREKLKALGGAEWVRDRIDRARPPG